MRKKPFDLPDEIKIQAIKNITHRFVYIFGHIQPLTNEEYLEKYRDILSFRKLHRGNDFEKSFYKRLQEMIQEEVEEIFKNRH